MAKKHACHPFPSPTARDSLVHHLLGDTGQALRQPLWTIMASAQLLLRSRDLSPRDGRLADRIDSAAHRLAGLARDLFDQALAQAGVAMPLAPRRTEMRALAQEAVLEAKVDNPDRWIMQASAGDGSAEWDPDRVLQLLSNLLAHALQHSVEDTPVSFAWWGEEEEVVVEVEYDPDRSGREREWTLGLSIAREIARAHGGDLALSDTSSGRLFRVALPRQIPVAPGRTSIELEERSQA